MNRYQLAIAAVLFASVADAQVGTLPEQSPFRDVQNRMAFTLLTGYFNAEKDPVGVAAQSAPYFGGRYDYFVGSLVTLTGRGALVPTKRTIIDPTRPAGQRFAGETNTTLFMVDGGLTLNVTGGKSYHNLVPEVTLGLGAVTDFREQDAGGYQLGTRLLFNLGGGIRWLMGSQWQLRVDASEHIYQVRYPDSYFVPSTDGTTVREGSISVNTYNLALSLGLSYRFFR